MPTDHLSLYQWANMIKGFALAIGVAFAIAMVILWWRRGQRQARIDRAAKAKSIYASYLQQALERPELARPDTADLAKPRTRAQYQWFVGFLLTSAEEILLIDPSPAWRDTLGRQLAQHRDFLANPAFRAGPYRNLTGPVRDVVDSVLEQVPAQPRRPGNVRTLRTVSDARV